MEILKKGILMAYISDHRKWFGMGFPEEEILMDYVSRSCDLPKKDIFDGLHKHFGEYFLKITKKGNLIDYISRSYDLPKTKNGDCLYKQVM